MSKDTTEDRPRDRPLVRPDEIDDATTLVRAARLRLFDACVLHASAKAVMEVKSASIILAGCPGSNEAARKAYLDSQLVNEQRDLHDAEQNLRRAQCEYDCALTELDRVRYLLRLMDVTQRIRGERHGQDRA